MKTKILLAEDDLLVSGLLEKVISDLGYQVEKTFLGKSVFSMCQKEDFDILVLDMLFPDDDGVSILQQLKIKLPEIHKRLKILAISGGGCGDFLSADFLLSLAKKRGAIRVLTKPFSMDVFKKEIEELATEELINE